MLGNQPSLQSSLPIFGCGHPSWLSEASFSFLGVPGQGTYLPGSPVTEAITSDGVTYTAGFTAETSNPALYQLTSIGVGSETQPVAPNANSPAFSFAYDSATSDITETITGATSVDTEVFDPQASAYALAETVAWSASPSLPGRYAFAADGQETVVIGSGAHAWKQTLPLDPTAAFTGLGTNTGSTANTITELIITGNAVVADTFTGSKSAGYALAQTSTTYIPATRAPSPSTCRNSTGRISTSPPAQSPGSAGAEPSRSPRTRR